MWSPQYCNHKINQITVASNRIIQSGNANVKDIVELDNEKTRLINYISTHKDVANLEIKYHNDQISLCRKEYQRIKN